MAGFSDSRASSFNAAAFRDAVKFAMKMGAPNATNEKATFIWTTERTFSKSDSNAKPWSMNATPITTSSYGPVQVDCAVEFQTRALLGAGRAMGDFDTPHAVITVLDDDYALLFDTNNRRADKVKLGGDTYKIDYVAPPIGLFAVTVYQLHCSAVDEV